MFDLSISNVFALGALCERVVVEEKPAVKPPHTDLDRIDVILARGHQRERHNDIVALIKKIVDNVAKIIDRNEGFSYHNELMAYIGQSQNPMTYSYNRGRLTLTSQLRRSELRLLISRDDATPDKIDFSAISRRRSVVITSIEKAAPPPLPQPDVLEIFKPVEGDTHPFEMHRDNLKGGDFGGRNIPSLTFYGRMPHFRRMEIDYLDQIHDRFLIGGPIKRSIFTQALELDYKNGQTQVFSVLYFWGLLRLINGNLYFNEPVIKRVMALLRSIDYIGISTSNNTEVLDNLERLVLNKQLLKRDINVLGLETHEKHKLITYKDEGLNMHRPLYVCYITAEGRRVYDTWLEIQKICEPYARQIHKKHNS